MAEEEHSGVILVSLPWRSPNTNSMAPPSVPGSESLGLRLSEELVHARSDFCCSWIFLRALLAVFMIYTLEHFTTGGHCASPNRHRGTSKQGGKTGYSSSNLGVKQLGIKEHGMCGRLIKGKEKRMVLWPATVDQLRHFRALNIG